MSRPDPAWLAQYHGAIDYGEIAKLGLLPEQVIDFSVNSNPFGPTEAVRNAVAGASISRYPDQNCLELKARIAAQRKVDIDQIVVGSGTSELLWRIGQSFFAGARRAVLFEPTFGEYARILRMSGVEIRALRTPPEEFQADHSAREMAFLEKANPHVLFLCNPNNPTGHIRSREQIYAIASRFPECMVIIDEAYAQFVQGFQSAADIRCDNIVVLHSMTKDYSLAGVRLGYLLACARFCDTLEKNRMPWNVSGIAQAAGIAALDSHDEYQRQWKSLAETATVFKQQISALGYEILPTPMHYFLMRASHALKLRNQLLQTGLLVRRCESFGLPDYLRLSARNAAENDQLVKTLHDLQHQ